MTGPIGRIDDAVDGCFDRLRGHPVADRVFYTASSLGEFSLIWIVFALLRALRGRKEDERAAARAIAGSLAEFVLVNVVLKSLFRRARPSSELVHPHPFRQPLTTSFPSGHATAAFCAATLLSEDDALAPVYFATAVVVSLSRIHTKIHHASDVAGGAAIGTVLGFVGRRLAPLRPKRAH